MAKNETRIVFNSEGFREILLSEGVRNIVTSTAEEIRTNADANNTRGGEGFKASVQVGGFGGGRWVGFVTAADNNASIAEAEDQALTRAIT